MKSRIHYKIGGRPIGAGGFGCVFKPPLKCKIQPPGTYYDESGVSKLMMEKDIGEEIEEINRIKPMLTQIPNYKNFYLIDNVYSCEPQSLDAKDKFLFDKTCRNFRNSKINSNTVNSNLGELGVINLPYGGSEVHEIFEKLIDEKFRDDYDEEEVYNHVVDKNNKEFVKVNKSLINLYINGILPLNDRGLLHLDLKGQNMVFDGKFARLIDWGLAKKYTGSAVVDMYTGPQFNAPYSNVLFDTDLMEKYFSTIPDKEDEVFSLVRKMYEQELKDKGHFDVIVEILKTLYRRDIRTDKEAIQHISFYLTQILMKYNNNGKFDALKYFNEVYVKNVDLWGFMTTYIAFILSKKDLWNRELEFRLMALLRNYCYSVNFAIKPIPVTDVFGDLLKMNTKILYGDKYEQFGNGKRNNKTKKSKKSKKSKKLKQSKKSKKSKKKQTKKKQLNKRN